MAARNGLQPVTEHAAESGVTGQEYSGAMGLKHLPCQCRDLSAWSVHDSRNSKRRRAGQRV